MPKSQLSKKEEIIAAMERLKTAYLNECEIDEIYEKTGKEKEAAHEETKLARDELYSLRFN